MRRFPLNGPLCVTVAFWAMNFVSLKLVFTEISPPAVALQRWIVMTLALLALCAWRGVSLRFERAETWRLLGAGALSMGVYMVFFMEGMRRTTPAEGSVVLATAPLITYGITVLLKVEPFVKGALLGSAVAFAGVATVVFGGTGAARGDLAGDGLVFLSAIAWAVSAVAMRPMVARRDPLSTLTVSMFGALPILLVWGLGPTLRDPVTDLSASGWANFVQISLGSGVLAFLGFYAGVRDVGASVATLYQFAVPPLAATIGWIVLGQALGPVQWLGPAWRAASRKSGPRPRATGPARR